MPARVIAVAVPEYSVECEPDYLAIGSKVDRAIVESFGEGRYIYRAIGKDDHPGLSLDQLVAVILEHGTDRYDPHRKGVCHEEFQPYDYNLHAAPFEIKESRLILDDSYKYPTLFGDTMHDFYEKTLYDRGYRVRIDILTLYDADQLVLATKSDPAAPGVAPRLERYLYRFKDRGNKQAALLGVVLIGRG